MELARSVKVIVHIDGGLHSDEVAGTQHTMVLAYKLLIGEERPGDRRDSRPSDSGAVAHAQSRRAGHGGALVSAEPGHASMK